MVYKDSYLQLKAKIKDRKKRNKELVIWLYTTSCAQKTSGMGLFTKCAQLLFFIVADTPTEALLLNIVLVFLLTFTLP